VAKFPPITLSGGATKYSRLSTTIWLSLCAGKDARYAELRRNTDTKSYYDLSNVARIGRVCVHSILPRNAMHCIARLMPWCAVYVCPSVPRLSRRVLLRNVYPQTLSSSGSPTILVFPYETVWRNSDGVPLIGASNAGGL